MPHPCPHHCPPERGGPAALAILVLVVVIAAAAGPAAHAASDMLRLAVDFVEIAVIVVASAAVLGVAGWAASVALHARQRRANGITAVSFHPAVPERAAETLTAPQRAAIEAPRPSLYVTTSEHPAPIEEDPCSPWSS